MRQKREMEEQFGTHFTDDIIKKDGRKGLENASNCAKPQPRYMQEESVLSGVDKG